MLLILSVIVVTVLLLGFNYLLERYNWKQQNESTVNQDNTMNEYRHRLYQRDENRHLIIRGVYEYVLGTLLSQGITLF